MEVKDRHIINAVTSVPSNERSVYWLIYRTVDPG